MWGYEMQPSCCRCGKQQRYESPCGVMSACPSHGLMPKACYESPCGVMRPYRGLRRGALSPLRIPMWGYELCAGLLRIPMWGYEASTAGAGGNQYIVTNPHVGL